MLKVDEDVINLVQSKFTGTEHVNCIHLNVSLLEEWTDAARLLALVQDNSTSSSALFLLLSQSWKPRHISDLSVESVVPIDEHFSCDTVPIDDDQDYLALVLNYRCRRLRFRLQIGPESSTFASEVIRARERIPALLDTANDHFAWLIKYSNTMAEAPMVATSSTNRDSILRYQLKLKEPEYTNQQQFRIFVGTWNVNGQFPTVSLKPWLSCDPEPPDLYAVGFQEIDLSKEAFLFNDTPREAEWQRCVIEGVHSDASYRLVAFTRLVGMQLVVMVNNKHYPFVRNVAVDTVGTGLLGKMGNKGGVAVRLELHNTSLCFVNSHLAAHVEEFERRNQDYKDINARINFRRHPQSIKLHDQIYWLGDLNYRIIDLNTSQVRTLLARNEIPTLLRADQLNQQKDRGNVFLDYTEAEVTFWPTYKYDLNTDTFDTSEKARPPAWTDRILYRGLGIHVDRYRSHMDLRMSDHKPVSALFTADILVVDQTKFRKIHEDLLKRMDKMENEFLPQVTLDRTEVQFNDVKFLEPQSSDIIIANTGQVPAEFEFIKKLGETKYCKEWLRISPYMGSIDPGQKCDVRLEVTVETDLDTIYDILVLHLKGGKDMFITVSGNCQRCSFTVDMTTLCRVSVPIMHLNADQWQRHTSPVVTQEPSTPLLYSVPRELWLLVDYLYRHGMKSRELFEKSAPHEELCHIRDWLDFGSIEPIPGTVTAVAECLLLFLSYTKEPVIPHDLHDNCIATASNFPNCRQIVQQKLSDVHRNVFLYLCLFLQELLKYSSENGYDARTLASLFGDILLRDAIRNVKPQANRGKASFVYNFLVNDISSLIISSRGSTTQ